MRVWSRKSKIIHVITDSKHIKCAKYIPRLGRVKTETRLCFLHVRRGRDNTACLFSQQFWQLTDHLKEFISRDESKCITEPPRHMAAPVLRWDTPTVDAKHPPGDEEEGWSGDLDRKHDLELRCDFPNLAVSMRREADTDTRNQEGIQSLECEWWPVLRGDRIC